MAAATKTSVKQHFETGDIPTQAQFGELIDSYTDFNDTLLAIATAAQGGQTGVVIIDATTDATTASIGSVGKLLISVGTTASAIGHMNAMTTDTTQTITGAKTFGGLVRVSAAVTIVNTHSDTALRIVTSDATAGTVNAPIFLISREYSSTDWANGDFAGGIRWNVAPSAAAAGYVLANQFMEIGTALTSATDARLVWATRAGDTLTRQLTVGGSGGGVSVLTSGNPLGTGTINANRLYSHNGRQVTPHQQAFAWAKQTGAGVLQNSINVASVVDNGPGDFSVVFSTAASDADYGFQITHSGVGETTVVWCVGVEATAGGLRYRTLRGAAGASAADITGSVTVTFWDDNPSQGTRAS